MRLLEIIRTAIWVHQKQGADDVIIPVPRELAPQVVAMVWEHKVSKASERWVQSERAVSLDRWQQAYREIKRVRDL